MADNRKRILLKTKDTALVMGISINTLAKWAIEPAKREGRAAYYDIGEVVQYRIEQLESRQEKTSSKSEEEVLLLRARRQKAELQTDMLRGTLLRYDDVVYEWADHISTARAQLLNVPAKVASQLEGDPIENQHLIAEEIRHALLELEDYEPKSFGEKPSTSSDEASGETLVTTGKRNNKPVGRRRKKASS